MRFYPRYRIGGKTANICPSDQIATAI